MFSSLTRYLYTICLLMTAGITPLLAASPLHYEAQPVTHLEVIVVTSQADSNSEAAAIVTRMKTREGEFFSQANLDADLKALSLSYDRIEPSLQADAEGLKITLKVWPKPTIRALIWEGNEREDSSTLRSQLGINVYTAFDRQAFNTAFHKLQAYYFKHGYFEAELNYTINYDPLTNEVDITIKICEGRAGYIQEIIFRNFEKCDEDAILELMSTKQYNFFTSWMTQQGSFMPEAIERDQIGIVHYLQDKGYADASVNITVEEIPERHRINVIITAQLGERYRFGEITFEGNKLFDDATIHKALNLKADAPYSPELLREMIYFLTNLYGKRGYIEAYVNYEARLRPDSNIYDIHITIEEDKQYYVGMIQIFGNSVTQSRVILHEVLMLPGQVFNQEKLRKTEERLLNIGYFKSVNVYAARSDGNSFLPDNYRDIHIEVE
jgi:outer membrane protein insertion porin family